MIKSVTIGDSGEDVIYLLTVSDVATGQHLKRLLCMKFSN